MKPLPDAADRFRKAAEQCGLVVDVKVMADTTRTAEDAAAACDCAVGQIVKSLVFVGRTSGEPVLLLVSGDNRVDQKRVANDIGERLDRPDAEFVKKETGFTIGGIPPLGHTNALKTFIDADLLDHPTVWAAAGTPNAVFAVEPTRLAAAANATTIKVAS